MPAALINRTQAENVCIRGGGDNNSDDGSMKSSLEYSSHTHTHTDDTLFCVIYIDYVVSLLSADFLKRN